MSLMRTVLDCVPRTDLRPLPVLESEIREELQFHLEMRTLDNIAAGMPPEQAFRDAQERFGDFEQNYQACRRATLGLRLALARLQSVLLVVLVAAVVYLAVSLLKTQADYRAALQSLTEKVEGLEHSRAGDVAPAKAAIPYRRWEPTASGDAASTAPGDATAWQPVGRSLDEPWSDWSRLETPGDDPAR